MGEGYSVRFDIKFGVQVVWGGYRRNTSPTWLDHVECPFSKRGRLVVQQHHTQFPVIYRSFRSVRHYHARHPNGQLVPPSE